MSCCKDNHLPLDLVMQASIIIDTKFHFRFEKNIHSSKRWHSDTFSVKITHSLNVQNKMSTSLLCCFSKLNTGSALDWSP